MKERWLKESDIVKFYREEFDFPETEVHFSVRDIIMNLDNIPGRDALVMEVTMTAEELERLTKKVMAQIDEELVGHKETERRCGTCGHKVKTNEGEWNPHDIVCNYWESDGLEYNDFCSYWQTEEKP